MATCERCGNTDGGDGGDVEFRNIHDAYQCDKCWHLHTKPGASGGGGARRRGGMGSGDSGRRPR